MWRFLQDERGAAAIEYSLFVSLIGLVVAFTLHALGANLLEAFSLIEGGLSSSQVIVDPRFPN